MFVHKYFNGSVPGGRISDEIMGQIGRLYDSIGTRIESGCLKNALDDIFAFTRYANKYFDTEKPWETRTSNAADCNSTICNCVQIIANLSVLLEPFLPFSSKKIKTWLQLDNTWHIKNIPAGVLIPEPELLFTRLDKGVADEELKRLSLFSDNYSMESLHI